MCFPLCTSSSLRTRVRVPTALYHPSLAALPPCRGVPAGALRPTLFCGVPRVFDRIYSGVMQKVGVCGG